MAAEEDLVSGNAEGLAEAWAEPKPLEGRLVEIFGLGGMLCKAVSIQDEDAEAEDVDVNGERGRCLTYFEPEQKYIVETFAGILVGVPEGNVREYFPPPATEGGFDLIWPAGADATEYFGADVCSELATKGYCLIQTFMSEDERKKAVELAEEEDRPWFRIKQEVESGYLGYDNNTKMSSLPPDEPEEEVANPIMGCDRQMTTLGLLLAPLAPANLGFQCHGRMSAMLRMTIDKNEADDLPPESLANEIDGGGEEWGTDMEAFVRFSQRRKLCIISIIDNEGGTLWLYPKEGTKLKVAQIPLTPNKLLVFRHDLMDYSYQVSGPSLAVQTWVVDEMYKYQKIKEMAVTLAAPGAAGEVVVNPGPEVPDGPKASIMALTTRLPGEAWNPSQYWLMFCSGCDSVSQWPFSRWATEPYYEEGGDSNLTGKAYTCHGGFVSEEQITQFDNEFFGIDYTEARSMLPGQKMVLEVGYQCFVASGFNKQTLKGRRVGCWMGDVGPDWHSFQAEWGRFNHDISPTTMGTSMNNAVTAGRIAHVFDLKGPVSSYDTACSASLVAMNAAHLLMFDEDTPTHDNSEAFVGGVNTLLGPGSFIGNCMATMLSHQGRSFTFNRSADGYQRGEGCGCIFVKLFTGDKKEEEERVCALIGTATNQDGRSASLTAPNGPAQQQVIKKSMRFAGINPNTVSIAECHGTGTALGDPIEVGALMAVMHQREFPILKTSAKSNIGHLEAGAGIAGLTKCIMMINMSTAPPNCHFNIINPHLTTEGYPVYFDTEDVDTAFSSLYCGVSSFGFGGTNSRADVYGFASKGHKQAIRFELPRLTPQRVLPIGQTVYIIGTWSGWSVFDRMDSDRDGVYTCAVTLGETRWEQFQLTTSEDAMEVIHPLVPEADQHSQIVGPDFEGKDLNFMIDGRRNNVAPGTIYEITFTWTEESKTISWTPVGKETDMLLLEASSDYTHTWSLVGSWRHYLGFDAMTPDGNGAFIGRLKIGHNRKELFHIVRDSDPKQAVYPALDESARKNVPVIGPDAKRDARNWLVTGPQHSYVQVKLSLSEGQASVSLASTSLGELTLLGWDAWIKEAYHTFFIAGSFNNGHLTPMVPEDGEPGVYTCQCSLDYDGQGSFQIVVDEDVSLTMYPDDTGMLAGPASDAPNAWYIHGMGYASYEVKLDLSAASRAEMVSWEPISQPALT